MKETIPLQKAENINESQPSSKPTLEEIEKNLQYTKDTGRQLEEVYWQEKKAEFLVKNKPEEKTESLYTEEKKNNPEKVIELKEKVEHNLEYSKNTGRMLETAMWQEKLDSIEAGEKPPAWFKDMVNEVLNSWFDPKSFESPELYEKLGIRAFKKYMPTTGDLVYKLVWKRFGAPSFVSQSNPEQSMKEMLSMTKFCEVIHIFFFAVMVLKIGPLLMSGALTAAAAGAAINTLVNVYPVMLQRYNRDRLVRALQKRAERRNSNDVSEEELKEAA